MKITKKRHKCSSQSLKHYVVTYHIFSKEVYILAPCELNHQERS